MKEEQLKKYYFTFCLGDSHQHSGGCYTIIEAKDYGEAREIMVKRFGMDWAFQYDSEEKAGIKKFNLRLIK